MQKCLRQSGFTLVELLVVISIIALLVSILLPALNRARAAAITVKCVAQQKQLVTAWVTYAADQEGRLVGGHVGNTHGWVSYPQDEAGNFDVSTTAHRLRGLQRGAFFRYISNNLEIYRCPAARNNFEGPTSGSYRTYMIAGGLNGDYYSWEKYGKIREPSARYVFVESVNPDGWNVGAWDIVLPDSPFDGSWNDSLTVLHGDRSTLSFVDGHGETRRWLDERTLDLEYGFFLNHGHQDNPDYRYMQRHFPHDKSNVPR